jgi:hypothetical protein
MRDLIIVGSGGFARETAAAVHAINELHPTWRLLGFLNDDEALRGQCPYPDVPVLDGVDAAREMRTASVVVCVGNPRGYAARSRVVRRLALPPERYATVMHPSVQVSASCVVGPGSVLLAQAVLTADVRVGAHVAVMPQVVLTHDDVHPDRCGPAVRPGTCVPQHLPTNYRRAATHDHDSTRRPHGRARPGHGGG